jgi:hypothetical protein
MVNPELNLFGALCKNPQKEKAWQVTKSGDRQEEDRKETTIVKVFLLKKAVVVHRMANGCDQSTLPALTQLRTVFGETRLLSGLGN